MGPEKLALGVSRVKALLAQMATEIETEAALDREAEAARKLAEEKAVKLQALQREATEAKDAAERAARKRRRSEPSDELVEEHSKSAGGEDHGGEEPVMRLNFKSNTKTTEDEGKGKGSWHNWHHKGADAKGKGKGNFGH